MINNRTLKLLVDEATRWRDTKYASENLGAYLDKIKMVVDESRQIPESYGGFILKNPIKDDLNQKARAKIKAEINKLQSKLAKESQMKKQMAENKHAYNGFVNPHNVKGHKCDINCYNSMTMANQFPHLTQ